MGARQITLAPKPWNLRFRERRLSLDLSQEYIAEKAKITQQAVSRFEHGAIVPRISTLERLAAAVGTSVEELFPMEAHPKGNAS